MSAIADLQPLHRQRGHHWPVADQNQSGFAIGQPPVQPINQAGLCLGVKTFARLIKHQPGSFRQQSACQSDPPLLPSGKPRTTFAKPLVEPVRKSLHKV